MRLIDRNQSLSNFLRWFTPFLAQRRGLLMLLGAVLCGISWAVTLIVLVLIVNSDEVADIWLLFGIPASLLHLSVLVGFIGFMIAVPLGQGYE